MITGAIDMTTMKVVCAWCGADLGEKDGKGEDGISHGMCDKCFAKVRSRKAKCQPCGEESTGRSAPAQRRRLLKVSRLRES